MSAITDTECSPILKTTTQRKFNKFARCFPNTDDDDIVISGMAGRFPNCHNVSEYENCLYNKIDMVDDDERRWRHFNPEMPKRGGKIYDLEKFDSTFFGIHSKHAHVMDPQARILIETAYEAVIDAGINPEIIRGSKTGVYIASCNSDSEKTWLYKKAPTGGNGIISGSRAMMANRISYCLGLIGPSSLVDSACSSSMYALDNAFSAIRNGEIDAAIIGGSNLILHPFVTQHFARLGVLAPDGCCRPFDKNASGFTRSEAISCLFLQRKQDAKRIYASVVYSKTNCDGYKPEGITYPSGDIQGQLLKEFYEEIDVSPENLGYLEAHGTGTPVGDPAECRGIDIALGIRRSSPLPIGSVKSNMGHAEAASGVCSLVKACLALETGKIAPNIHFGEANPEIPAVSEGRLVVVTDVMELEKPYIAVNSFGFGGANAHTLLKAIARTKANNGLPEDDIPRLVTWAGSCEESVNTIMDDIAKRPLDAEFIALLQNIQKVEVSRMVFRGFGVFSKNGTEAAINESRDVQHYTGVKRPIVWVFSGMGSEWNKMGVSLMVIPQFRHSIELCHATLLPKGLDLIHILTSDDPLIFENILHSFVGIAAIQIALVDVLRSLNLEPDYIIGHSVGELGCGYADGGFTPEQMILAAYYRGKVSLDVKTINGSLSAIGMGYNQIVDILPESIEVACRNGAGSCTISGPADDVKKFVTELESKNIFAKELNVNNIAYHSRYIANMGPQLKQYLQQTIPNPKPRSPKWLSTSVPKNEWDQSGNNLCSAEYHTNNLLNSVLFEETFALLPDNALTIEIAPHGLLQGILRLSMPSGVHVPVSQRANKNNGLFFMSALGRLFINGVTLPVANLYPRVSFPVSRHTPGISSLIRWDHSEDFFVTKYENMKTHSKGERVLTVDLATDDDKFISGHMIDGKILLPATCYLQYVWETFSLMYHGPSFMDVPVEFEDIKFLRATNMALSGNIKVTVMIHYGTGNFEITESGAALVTGRISEIKNPTIPEVYDIKQDSNVPKVLKKDFYKELKLRGYQYTGDFQAVREARADGLHGKVEWKQNWVTFLDGMLQIPMLCTNFRSLLLPTMIRKLRISGRHHVDMIKEMDPENTVFDVHVDHINQRVVSGGIEVIGIRASTVQRRRQTGIHLLEKYQFLPHLPSPALTAYDAVRSCVQIAVEYAPMMKIKVVEVYSEGRQPLMENFLGAVQNSPLVNGEFLVLSDQTMDELPSDIRVENGKLSTQTKCQFIVVGGLSEVADESNLKTATKSLAENGYLVVRERTLPDIDSLLLPENFTLIAVIPLTNNEEVILLLKYKPTKTNLLNPLVIQVSASDTEYEWITLVHQALENKTPTVLYAYNEKLNGLLGLVNCLRKEPYGNLVSCFFIDDSRAPAFRLDDPFYAKQYELGLAINVYRNGKWGTYRFLKLNTDEEPRARADHIYGNVLQPGDLSSLRWIEGPLDPKDAEIKVVYSSLNFRDVMLASGRLPIDIYGTSWKDQLSVLGFEYSGINTSTGRRIMSMIANGGMASYVGKPSQLTWEVPDHWTLQDAATVPVVYVTVYYAFFVSTDIRNGKSILIHTGTGGIGMAAIRTALAYNLEVFTTCSTPEKKQFLLDTFPQLKESNIGNSRDTSFEQMVLRETNGNGVDFVLNSLSEDKLLASVRCLGMAGQFLEIGKFDLVNDTKLGMSYFLKQMSFHTVFLDCLYNSSIEKISHIKQLIDTDIARGIIQPLPSTVFPANEIEQAFRHLAGGKHMGKVMLKLREDPNSNSTVPVKVLKRIYFKPNMSYIIPGGLGGFGLELADWMVSRGARNILLNSRRGITNSYQSYRIALWKSYRCKVEISTSDITTFDGCNNLLDEAEKMGPIGGIFNLAVALQDAIFLNQTKDSFLASFSPKSVATMFLDELSRKRCHQLQHFVVFSSTCCGRGNAGQTNYGMANSIIERIIEGRIEGGYPGKAIEWGPVGEVGIAEAMAEQNIDVEILGARKQRISSCLQQLDMLLFAPEAVVSSLVVGEKRAGRSGNESAIETVMNMMGIRDLRSVSLGTTLSEMGMDSLMALDIKLMLERDFDLVLTAQDLRSLTFQKLQEYEEARKHESSDVIKMIFNSEINEVSNLLIRNLGDETDCKEVLLPLQTAAVASKLQVQPRILIPGVEGTAGKAWRTIGSKMNSNTTVLQIWRFAEMTTIEAIAEAAFDHVKAVLKTGEPFYIIGYSFGAYIALHLAGLLENCGYRGKLMLIDGAPHLFTRTLRLHLGVDFPELGVYDELLAATVNTFFPEKTKELIRTQFQSLPTLEEKMATFSEFVGKQDTYGKEYSQAMMHAIYKRLYMAAHYDLENFKKVTTPIALIRPAVTLLQDIPEDYCLDQFTSGKVTINVIEGDHATMLDNSELSQLINDFDPTTEEDK